MFQVRLKKEGRNLMLSVDNDPLERRRGPKKINIGSVLYIGGLPDNNLLVPDNFVSVKRFSNSHFVQLNFKLTKSLSFSDSATGAFQRLYEKSDSQLFESGFSGRKYDTSSSGTVLFQSRIGILLCW